MIGNGDGSLSPAVNTTVGGSPLFPALADLNADGNLDLALTFGWTGTSSTVSIYLGNGTGTFSFHTNVNAATSPRSIDFGDVNADGKLDMVVGHATVISVNLGLGNGSFVAPTTHSHNSAAGAQGGWAVRVRDFDDDGDDDVLTASRDLDTVRVWPSRGDGTLASQLSTSSDYAAGDQPAHLDVGDMNGDGRLDIVVKNAGDDTITILYGVAFGVFTNRYDFSAGSTIAGNVAIGDVDQDGRNDVISSHRFRVRPEFPPGLQTRFGSSVYIFSGNGDGTVGGRQDFTVGREPRVAVLADLDGDADLDIVTANAGDDSISVRLNRALAPQTNGFGEKRFEYDPVYSKVTRELDELGHETLYEIDPVCGCTLSMTQVVGLRDTQSSETDDVVYQFDRRPDGLLNFTVDPLGRVTAYDYDARGLLTHVTYAQGTPDEAVVSYEYDLAGNTTAMIDGNGNRTAYEYDGLNRLIRTIQPDPDGAGSLTSPMTVSAYDADGRLAAYSDARGNTSSFTYDSLDRLFRVTGPDPDSAGPLSPAVSLNVFNVAGQLIAETDPLGHVNRYEYDSRGRRIASIDPDGGLTSFGYDADGNLVLIVDPDNNATRFVYDQRGRLVTEIDPLGAKTVYRYDSADNVVEKVDRNGRRTVYEYDDLDRMIQEAWKAADNSDVNVITYALDAVGNLLGATDNQSSLTYTIDHRDRVNTVGNLGTPGAPNVALTYSYDDNGNVLSVADTINGAPGATIAYVYDGLNRLTTLTKFGPTTAENRVDFSYNALGQYDAIERYRDLVGTQLIIRTDYTYDDQNRLTRIDHQNTLGANVAFYDYVYDPASRITQITDIDGITTYGYDGRNQLTSADHTDPSQVNETYEYDANGNRLDSHVHGTDYITGPGNRLLSDGTYNYDYDGEGNMVRRTEIATGNFRAFDWDHRNRLVAVADHLASGIPTQELRFTYDAHGRRISKTVDTTPLDSLNAAIMQFVYDREDIILDVADADGSGPQPAALSQRYLHGPAVDQVLAQGNTVEGVVWLLTDRLGSVRDLVDNNGIVANHLIYDAFGNLASQSNSASTTRYLFTGREFDMELGLQYSRARYYDAIGARFISEDPARFAAQDVNLYRYASNNPIAWADPLGLEGGAVLNGFSTSPAKENALRQAANKLSPDGYTFTGHGNQKAVKYKGKWVTPEQLAEIIKKDQRYKKGDRVTLLACNTGALEDSFAQHLANALNAPVRAPDTNVWWYPNGSYRIAPTEDAPARNLNPFTPEKPTPGFLGDLGL